jgi:hypothetical protein
MIGAVDIKRRDPPDSLCSRDPLLDTLWAVQDPGKVCYTKALRPSAAVFIPLDASGPALLAYAQHPFRQPLCQPHGRIPKRPVDAGSADRVRDGMKGGAKRQITSVAPNASGMVATARTTPSSGYL